jgi:hypothetical protein
MILSNLFSQKIYIYLKLIQLWSVMSSGGKKSKMAEFAKSLAPLIFGVVLGAFLTPYFSLYIPQWFDNTAISYTKDISLKIVDSDAKSNVELKINNETINKLFGQSIRIWNSGHKSINDLHITYYFGEEDENFRIFDVIHNVSPLHEINYTLLDESNNYKRYSYLNLNPNDEFSVLFLSNKIRPITLSISANGLVKENINEIDPVNDTSSIWSWLLPLLIGGFIVIIAVILFKNKKNITSISQSTLKDYWKER